MAITKTTETLMLLKGSRANLANMAINPGSIYFTTDYPGIYVDLAAEGGKSARRLRMGDVTVVDNLAVLKGLVNLKTGQDGVSTWSSTTGWSDSEITDKVKPETTPILTDKALYYAIAENVLCMYDDTNKRFIWINDHTELNNAITALETAIDGTNGLSERLTAAEGAIGDIEDAIGDADNPTSGTVYGAIDAVDARIGAADGSDNNTVYSEIKAINEAIQGIIGDGDGSIGDLQDQINDLTEADATLENTINKVYGDTTNGVPTSPTATVLSNASAIADINTRLGADFETNAQVNKIETVSVKIDGGTELASKSGKAVTVTLPKDLTAYDSTGIIGDLQEGIAEADGRALDVYGATSWPTGDLTATVLGNKKLIDELKGISTDSIDSKTTVHANKNAITALKGTTSDTTTGTVLGNAVVIGELSTAVDNIGSASIAAGKADSEGTATEYLDVVRKIAVAQAKDYVDAELNSKIAAVNAMAFKGAVDALTDLPKTGVQAGDTYVVSADISVGGTITYHIGDLFIATNDQGSSASYPQTIVNPGSTTTGWFWIKTGYDSHFEPSLDVEASTTDPTITLRSHVGSDLGDIKLVDAGQNIQITTTAKTGTTPAQISFNLVWATF